MAFGSELKMRLRPLILILVFQSALWPQSSPQNAPATAVLPVDTVVRLRTTQSLSTRHAKTGDAVPLEVMRDVKVGDLLVIAKHTPVTARLSSARRAGHALRRGSLTLAVSSVPDINGKAIALSGTRSEKPDPSRQIGAYTETALSMGFLVPVLLFTRGDEAVLNRGEEVDVIVGQDVTLDAAQLKQRMAALDAEAAMAREKARTGNATLHFYLYPEMMHDARTHAYYPREDHMIWVDGSKVVRLRNGRFFELQIAPGHHLVACHGSTLPLDAKADANYYLRMARSDHWLPELTDQETAEDEMYTLAPADARDVQVAVH